jgi:hypothetical protein
MRSCREPIGADLNHPIISSLVMFRSLGFSALGSLHTVNRFIDLAIAVRTSLRVAPMSLKSQFILSAVLALLLGALLLWWLGPWLLVR